MTNRTPPLASVRSAAFPSLSAELMRRTPGPGARNREVFCGLPGMDEAELAALPEARIIW